MQQTPSPALPHLHFYSIIKVSGFSLQKQLMVNACDGQARRVCFTRLHASSFPECRADAPTRSSAEAEEGLCPEPQFPLSVGLEVPELSPSSGGSAGGTQQPVLRACLLLRSPTSPSLLPAPSLGSSLQDTEWPMPVAAGLFSNFPAQASLHPQTGKLVPGSLPGLSVGTGEGLTPHFPH